MPRAPSAAARLERNQAMQADRARGWTMRKIAKHYGLGLQTVHRVTRHVPIQTPGPWHLTRLPKTRPAPALPLVHRIMAPAPR